VTKEEFIAGYCTRSGITREQFDARQVALPCTCDYENCAGWAAVPNDSDLIRSHMDLYAPDEATREAAIG
jgi:hypothetical protein